MCGFIDFSLLLFTFEIVHKILFLKDEYSSCLQLLTLKLRQDKSTKG